MAQNEINERARKFSKVPKIGKENFGKELKKSHEGLFLECFF